MKRVSYLISLVGLILLFSGCGGGGNSGGSPSGSVVLTSIEVTPATAGISLPQSEEQQFTATGLYSDGSTSDITSTVTWSSDDTGIVDISTGGLVSTVSTGQAAVSATLDGFTGSATLTVYSVPTISSVTPETVCAGDIDLTITGDGFWSGSGVEISGAATVSSVTFISATSLDVSLSGVDAGTYDITVLNGAADTDTSVAALSIEQPIVFMMDSLRAYNGINTPLSIYLTGLSSDSLSAVDLVDPGGSIITLSSNLLTKTRADVTVPAGLGAGDYDLRVTTGNNCTTTVPGAYSIQDTLVLSITEISPASISQDEISRVTIKEDMLAVGSDFSSTPEVYLVLNPGQDGVKLSSAQLRTADELIVTVPSNLTTGSYDVVVVNPDGAIGVASSAITVYAGPSPVIDEISPSNGVTNVDTAMTITGINFDVNGSSVEFNCRDSATDTFDGTFSGSSVTPSGTSAISVLVPTTIMTPDTLCSIDVIGTTNGAIAKYSGFYVRTSSSFSSSWKLGSTMIIARNNPAVAVGANSNASYLYAVGGDDFSNTIYSSVEYAALDRFGNPLTWQQASNSFPVSITSSSAVSTGEFIYVLGGKAGTTVYDTLYRAMILQLEDSPIIADVTPSISGGIGLTPGLWYYRVSATFPGTDGSNPNGETIAGPPQMVRVLNMGQSVDVTLEWPTVTGADGYRVYRTPVVDGDPSTMELVADVGANSYTDTGTATNNIVIPLESGELGKWHVVTGSTLNTAREAHGFEGVWNPSQDKFVLYAIGGRDSSGTVLQSIEYATITVAGDGSQTVSPFTTSSNSLSVGRAEIDLTTASAEDSASISGTEKWLYIGPGLGSSGLDKTMEAGSVSDTGEFNAALSTTAALPGVAFSGYSFHSAGEAMLLSGGKDTAERSNVLSTTHCAPPSGSCLDGWNNAGFTLSTVRYLPGSTQDSSFMFIAGGNNGSTALNSIEISYK